MFDKAGIVNILHHISLLCSPPSLLWNKFTIHSICIYNGRSLCSIKFNLEIIITLNENEGDKKSCCSLQLWGLTFTMELTNFFLFYNEILKRQLRAIKNPVALSSLLHEFVEFILRSIKHYTRTLSAQTLLHSYWHEKFHGSSTCYARDYTKMVLTNI